MNVILSIANQDEGYSFMAEFDRVPVRGENVYLRTDKMLTSVNDVLWAVNEADDNAIALAFVVLTPIKSDGTGLEEVIQVL